MKKIWVLTGLVSSVMPALAVVGCEKSTTHIYNDIYNEGRNQNSDKNQNGDENQGGGDKTPTTQTENDLKLDWENSRTITGEDKDKKAYFIKHLNETFTPTVAEIKSQLEGKWKASSEDQKDIDKYFVLIFDKKIYLMVNVYTSYIGLKYLNNEIIIKNVFDVEPLNTRNCGIMSESSEELKHFENVVYDEKAMTFEFKNKWHHNYSKWKFNKDTNTLTLLEADNTYNK